MKPFQLSQRNRFILASVSLLVVFALLGICSVIKNPLESLHLEEQREEGVFEDRSKEYLLHPRSLASDPEDLLFSLYGRIADPAECVWDELPPGFESEVFNPEKLGGSEIISSRGFVGFTCSEPADQILGRIDDSLCAKSWVCVETGDSSCRERLLSYTK